MKTRSINELLILLSKQEKFFKSNDIYRLCDLILELRLTNEISKAEHNELDEYILKECPKTCKEYWYYKNQGLPFYFPKRQWPPRLRWLKSQIEITSNK